MASLPSSLPPPFHCGLCPHPATGWKHLPLLDLQAHSARDWELEPGCPGRGLVFGSMTPFPFVRKKMSVLPSVSVKATSGFLRFPDSPSRCPPGNWRLRSPGITCGAPSSFLDSPDTVADLSNRGEGFPMPPRQICAQIHSPVPSYQPDQLTSTLVFSPTCLSV